MPVHDWTRVSAGTFHHFHNGWITELSKALNEGILPADYYAMGEQQSGDVWPDLLTLHAKEPSEGNGVAEPQGAVAVAVNPPKVRFAATLEMHFYAQKQKTLVIRHSSGDRIVALLEIVSPANKSSGRKLQKFLDKAVAALDQGYHLLLIDLQPPSRRDPQGIHGALWAELGGDPYQAPADKPLTLAAYTADVPIKTYVEPSAVADPLPDMPLFLDPDYYVRVPLEKTYQEAWRTVPQRWRRVLDGLTT